MNTTSATPHMPTTVSMACPWCAEPLAVEDAFITRSVRCDACATCVDFEPVAPAASRPIRAAA